MRTLKNLKLAACAAILLFFTSSIHAKKPYFKHSQSIDNEKIPIKAFPESDQIFANSGKIFVYTPDNNEFSNNNCITIENEKVYVPETQVNEWPTTPRCGHPVFHWRCGGCDIEKCRRRCRCWRIK